MDLTLGLTLLGIVIGLIGAVPTLRAWYLAFRANYSESAKRRQERMRQDYLLLKSNPTFLVAFVAYHATLASVFAFLAFLLSNSTLRSTPWVETLVLAKLSFSLFAGFYLGTLIGMSKAIIVSFRNSTGDS